MQRPNGIGQLTAETLYHYTSQDGLLGILEGKTLWASHILYLNDRKEFWHAFDTAKQLIEEKIKQSKDDKERQLLERLLRKCEKSESEAPFVASFSEDGDSLSQWRGYGGNGNGFSIGFSRLKLKEMAIAEGGMIGQCDYHPDSQTDTLAQLINSVIEPTECDSRVDSDGTTNIFVMLPEDRFARNLSFISPLMKHPAFHEEKEWRITILEGMVLAPSHRPGRSMLIPFCKVPLNLSLIHISEPTRPY